MEIIWSIQKDVLKLYATTMLFYIKDLVIYGFSCLWESWNKRPTDTKKQL